MLCHRRTDVWSLIPDCVWKCFHSVKRRDDTETHRPLCTLSLCFSPSFVLSQTPVQLTHFTRARKNKLFKWIVEEGEKRKKVAEASWCVWCSKKQENLGIPVKKQCREEANLRCDWPRGLNKTELFSEVFLRSQVFRHLEPSLRQRSSPRRKL